MYIQGDVYLTETKEIPKNAEKVSARNGRFILAEGEATGHAHAVVDDELEVYERDGILYIKASRPFTIVHEEHAPVTVEPGIWEVDRQREYDPFLEETRIVRD
mgnify:CR=1 FL=1